jgi:IS30 family transposase
MKQLLTKKQRQVYDLLKEGESLVEIARELGKGQATIHEHLTCLERKGWAVNYSGSKPAWYAIEELTEREAKKMIKEIKKKYPYLL